jgi:glycosyltransferase involved in cell wall biosynthesis
LADATTFVCAAAARRHVAAGGVSEAKARVLPNGVDVGEFQPAAERPARAAPVWLAAGRLFWKKDYPSLLKAFAAVGAGELLIAGEGPDEAGLKALAAQLSANVRFLGRVDDMPRLMHSADALVLSSTVEGLPMVLLEAAANGLPAIATDVGGVREIVIDGETGFVVPPGDPAALSRALRRFADLPPEERARMGRRAREHAVAHFDLRMVVSEWERTYLELWESAP